MVEERESLGTGGNSGVRISVEFFAVCSYERSQDRIFFVYFFRSLNVWGLSFAVINTYLIFYSM